MEVKGYLNIKPLKRTRLFQGIVEQVQKLIKTGLLKPGDQLPPERELAGKLNVSRTSVREAMRTLEIMGYIDIRPGEGAFIKETTIDNVLKPITSAIKVEKDLILDLLDVRDVIEVAAAKRAATYATNTDIKRIRIAILNAKEDVKAGGIGLQGDDDFHLSIAKATHNTVFEVVMNLIEDLLTKSREATLQIPGQPTKTIKDHKKIYEAIKEKKPDEAAKYMKEHLTKAKNNILRLNT